MRANALVTIASLAVLMATTAVSADTLSPGKTVALTASPGVGVALTSTFGFAVSLERAKRHTVIFIDGTVSYLGGTDATDFDLKASVDTGAGVTTAQGGLIQTRCEVQTPCTLSGHWWVDVDALEAANPGSIANQPVDILLQGSHFPTTDSNGTGIAWYALRAQAVKK